MLNAVNTCPNIHWYCHECNSGNRNISASIDRINDAIGLLTSSLSGDLVQFVNGFKNLTEQFMKTVCHTVTAAPQKAIISVVNENPTPMPSPSFERKDYESILDETNNHSTSSTLEQCTFESSKNRLNCEASRSVVVSNIGKDITEEYLIDYLSDELDISREKIGVSLLLPAGKTIDVLNFLQFKITIPESKYFAIMDPMSWPTRVRVRDFVFKAKRIYNVVPKLKFLSRKKLCTSS